MSNVSALSARSPSEHVAPAPDSPTVDAPSAEPATPDAVTRDTKPDTTAKHTDKPKVRGPIEFDSEETPTEDTCSRSAGRQHLAVKYTV